MSKIVPTKSRTYYQKIVVLMLGFLLIVLVPVSLAVFGTVESSIGKQISRSNRALLKNMEYSYNYFRDDASNLCLTTFFDYDVRSILYNFTDESNSYNYIKKLQSSTLATNSSIYSICAYNSITDELYTTESNALLAKEELFRFIGERTTLPTLTPLLRPVTGWSKTEYVFSYFMYDPLVTENKAESFVVVNQKADWFLDQASISVSADSNKSRLYLADSGGEIYLPVDNSAYTETDSWLIGENTDLFNGEYMGTELARHGGATFILTYIRLQDDNSAIIMLQNYNDVFADLNSLKMRLYIIGVSCLTAGILLLIYISKKLYTPVDEFLQSIEDIDKIGRDDKRSEIKYHEFRYLHMIYRNANELNRKLAIQRDTNEDLIKQYHLRNLCEDSSEQSIKKFEQVFPGHWITAAGMDLCLLVFQYDLEEENDLGQTEESPDLVLYAAQNIAEELFSAVFRTEMLINSRGMLALFLGGDGSGDEQADIVEKTIRETNGYLHKLFHTAFSAAYSPFTKCNLEISDRYNRTLDLLPYRCIYGLGAVLTEKKCLPNIQNSESSYPQEMEFRLIESIMVQDMDEVREALCSISEAIGRLSYNNMLFSIIRLFNTINTVLQQTKHSQRYAHVADIKNMIISVTYFQNLTDNFYQYIESAILNDDIVAKTNKNQIFTDTVTQYVMKNYADINLSSQQIGDYIGMSQKHVMKKFKDCTGIALNKYINDVRMKTAERLLIENRLPIIKVAESVGYENESYFYRVFKNMYGCTPREYSERYRLTQAMLSSSLIRK